MELRTDFETRTNKFLYKINEEFFRPQGLYCLVMTWNPNTNQRIQQLDITSSIASHRAAMLDQVWAFQVLKARMCAA
jgi:hypothetical protein